MVAHGVSTGGWSQMRPTPIKFLGDVLELTDSEDDVELMHSDDPMELTDTEDSEDLGSARKDSKILTANANSLTTKVIGLPAHGHECATEAAIKQLSSVVKNLAEETVELRKVVSKVMEKNKEMSQMIKESAERFMSCPVCSEQMWTPYLLRPCGHTFCPTCLKEWFCRLKSKHLDDPSLPRYSCPVCRQTVKDSPTRVIAMKNQSEFFATFNGEAIPRQPGPNADNIWMLFFPPPT